MNFSNVLLIDKEVIDYSIILDSVNSNTYPFVYDFLNTHDDISNALQDFTSIDRIAILFCNNSLFLGNTFYAETNRLFLINLLKRFNVKNIDFLSCDTLKYPVWNDLYSILHIETGVIVGASDDKTGNLRVGGDWVLENTSEDVELIYFTNNIEYYNYVLGVGSFSMVIKSDNTIWATGNNQGGNLGNGTNTHRSSFQNVTPLQNVEFRGYTVQSISCGQFHTVVLMTNNTLWGVGYNYFGVYPVGNLFTKIPFNSSKIISLKCGRSHTVVLTNDNKIWGAGRCSEGQLGTITPPGAYSYDVFKELPGITGTIKEVVCGAYHTVVLTTQNKLWVTGLNGAGHLGTGDLSTRYGFTRIDIDSLSGRVPDLISAGDAHTIVTMTDGTLWGCGLSYCLGINYPSALGQNTFIQAINENNHSNGIRKPIAITCGQWHTVILMSDGTLWGAGYGNDGMLGPNGSLWFYYSQITPPTTLSSIWCGYGHTILLGTNNTTYVAGYNDAGQIGLPPSNQNMNFITSLTSARALPDTVIYFPPTVTAINSITPRSGTKNTSVTITGDLLSTTSTALVGGINAPINMVTATYVNITIPANNGNVSVVLIDNTGINTSYSENFTYQNPTVTGINPLTGTTNTLLTISGANLMNTSFVKLQGYNIPFTINSSISLTATVNASSGNASVVVVDNLGNNTSFSGNFIYQNATATSFNPTFGTKNTSVTLFGTNFTNMTYVLFGNASTSINTNTGNSINVSVPENSGNVSVALIDNGGISLMMPGTFTYQNPTVTGLTPLTGTTNTRLSITGANLANTSFVKLQGFNTSFTINSSISLTATVNASSGNASLVVADNLGNNASFSGNFTYQNPTVTSISPLFGMKNTTLNVAGLNLGNTSFVRIGGLNTSFTIVSPTSINASTPNTSGNASVVVSDNLGNNTSFSGNFVYRNLNVSSVSPLVGTTHTPFTITGTNLTNTSVVVFGNKNASIKSITSTSINGSVPSNTGNVSVYLIDNDGNSIYHVSNFVYQNPNLSTISPFNGTKNTILNISGLNLTNTSFVKIRGVNTSFVINSSVSMNVSAPENTNGVATVVATDNLGNNTQYSGFFTYTNPTIVSMNTSGAPNSTVVITGTNLTNTSAVFFNNTSTKFTALSNSINVSVPYAYGNVSVTVIDTAGNNYAVPGNFLYKTPGITGMSPETSRSNTTVTIYGLNLVNTSYVTFGSARSSMLTATSNTINVSTPLQNGNVSVVATDIYGNNASFSKNFLFVNTFISGINPEAAFPKTTLTLTGGYFNNTTTVYFGNLSTPFAIQSDNIINASVPSSTGNTSISILDSYGYTTYYPGNFTYKNMRIDAINPPANVKNSTLTINGEDLVNVISATVGSSPATVKVISNYQLQLTVPAPSGNGKITLTDSYGNTMISSQTFTTKIPTVTSLDKSSAHIGDTLTIYGTDLTYMNYVVFGSERATQDVVITDTQISCVIPYGIGIVSLQISDNYMNTIVLSSAFTYIPDVPIPKLVLLNRPYFTVRDASDNLYSSSDSIVTKNNELFYTNTGPISGIAVDGNILYMCEYSQYRIAKYNMVTQKKTALTILSSDNVQPNIIKVYDQILYAICNANPATTNPDYLYIFNMGSNTYQRKALLPAYTFQGLAKGQIEVSGVMTDCLYLSAILRNTPSNGRVCVADLTGTITQENYITNYTNPIDLLYVNEKLYIDGSTVILINVNSPNTVLATYQSSPSSQYNSVFYGTDASGNNVIYMINTDTNAVETVPAPSVLSSAILANTITPTSGTQNTKVVITGQNFLASDYSPQIKGVLFQSVAATNFTIVSSTLLYCDVPQGGGKATIQLVDMSDNPINTSLVFVYQTPTILDNYPKRSIINDIMYIYGNNMNLVTSVLIGSVSATFVLIRLDYLRVIIPNGSGVNNTITLIDTLNNVITNPAFTFSYYVYNSTICFPSGTFVKTDQGQVPIQKLVPGKHTLHGKKIVAMTETYSMDPDLVCIEKDALRKNSPCMRTLISPRHKIYDKGKMKAAYRFVGKKGFSFVPYQKEKLYNVLLKEHSTMNVQGMICETLDPANPVAKHYLQKLTTIQSFIEM